MTDFVTPNARAMEESLSSFAHRFPVSGRIVHAISDEFGGVQGLAEHLERNGHWSAVQLWMMTGKPVAMEPITVRELFSEDMLDGIGRRISIPVESVEIQAALGIPKFFSMLSRNHDDGLDLGYSNSTKRRRLDRVPISSRSSS